jgi:hypothetical protein
MNDPETTQDAIDNTQAMRERPNSESDKPCDICGGDGILWCYDCDLDRDYSVKCWKCSNKAIALATGRQG